MKIKCHLYHLYQTPIYSPYLLLSNQMSPELYNESLFQMVSVHDSWILHWKLNCIPYSFFWQPHLCQSLFKSTDSPSIPTKSSTAPETIFTTNHNRKQCEKARTVKAKNWKQWKLSKLGTFFMNILRKTLFAMPSWSCGWPSHKISWELHQVSLKEGKRTEKKSWQFVLFQEKGLHIFKNTGPRKTVSVTRCRKEENHKEEYNN